MLVGGTQMNVVTLIFVCAEIVILFYLTIYKLSRPDDKKAILNIWLVSLLLIYNIAGGLLPDPKLPGSLFLQEVIAYATGFITPSYFPYYVYRAFDLKKMKFHIVKGVSLFLLIPFAIFVVIYAATKDLDEANLVLFIPVAYAILVIISLVKALRFKYSGKLNSYEAREECIGLLLSLTPWIGLPVIILLNLSQPIEVSVTNTGFLLLLGLQLKNHISIFRKEHDRLIESEKRLLNWNNTLQSEVEKRTKDLEIINEQKANTFINLAHETKTPITLLKNYIEEFSLKSKGSVELSIIKNSITKLATDINNLLDNERFEKGLNLYDHNQTTSFSDILSDEIVLFRKYAAKKNIKIEFEDAKNIFIKADPIAINRIINNLIENAIKYSPAGTIITVRLRAEGELIEFSVQDRGIGIEKGDQQRVWQPYYQIHNSKKSNQGLGLGLPIVKKVIDGLGGAVEIDSDPPFKIGTTVRVRIIRHELGDGERPVEMQRRFDEFNEVNLPEFVTDVHDNKRQTVLLVEDNLEMVHYLRLKLRHRYNVYVSFNGSEALEKLNRRTFLPDIIISDIMMDVMDGLTFAEKLSSDSRLNHIPILFLSARASKSDRIAGLETGAVDFIAKPFDLDELEMKTEAILSRANNQRRVFLDQAIRALAGMEMENGGISYVESDAKFGKNCELYGLTARERAVAKLILSGATSKEIAETLYIADRTVTTHTQNIYEKVRVKKKVDLINKLTA